MYLKQIQLIPWQLYLGFYRLNYSVYLGLDGKPLQRVVSNQFQVVMAVKSFLIIKICEYLRILPTYFHIQEALASKLMPWNGIFKAS